jgi:hypothetical protein
MRTIAATGSPSPVPPAPARVEASAYGGLVLLRQAWTALGADALLAHGIRWQGQAGALLLFAVIALPVLGCGSVRAVADRCGRVRDPLWRAVRWAEAVTQRRLARFVTSARHDWPAVQGAMVRLLATHPVTALPRTAAGEGSGIVAVDSTTLEKRFARHLPHLRPVYDPVRRQLVEGYELVSACVVGPDRAWPVGLLPHAKADTAGERAAQRRRRRKAQSGERPSKLDLALQLVVLAIGAGVGAPTVVGDGAFAVNWWLREIAALGRHWLVATRHDRRLRIGAEVAGFATWVAREAPAWSVVEQDPDGGGIFGGLLPAARLLDKGCRQQGLPCRPAYLERRDRQGRVRHRWYLVTSQLDWDLATLWQHWQWRWQCEVFHRTCKQQLHLAAVHVRHWAGVVALVACTSLRASLLAFLRAYDPVCGALSPEALVDALRAAACAVEASAQEPVLTVQLPPTLPARQLWQQGEPAGRDPAWPLRLQAA